MGENKCFALVPQGKAAGDPGHSQGEVLPLKSTTYFSTRGVGTKQGLEERDILTVGWTGGGGQSLLNADSLLASCAMHEGSLSFCPVTK